MPGSSWQMGRARDFRGGETQASLPEEVGRNQLLRIENALLYPSGFLTASHQLDTQLVTGATLGLAIVPSTDGTYNMYSASGNGVVYGQFLDTGADSPVEMTLGSTNNVVGSRIVGVSRAVKFLGKYYCPNPNSDDTKDGILNLTDFTLINIPGSSATAGKLRLYVNRLWMIYSDGTLRHSDNGNAASWNALNVILLPNSEPIVDFHPVQGGAIIYSRSAIYAMYGSTYTDITFIELLQSDTDNPKHFTTGSVEVNGVVYILGAEGVYQASLNGAQLVPHHQETFFKAYHDIYSDPNKTMTAMYLKDFNAIIFTCPEVYKVGGQSLVFYLTGAYSKLNKLLPTAFPYALAMNDGNTDFIWGSAEGILVKSEYPSANQLTPQVSIIQTRHEDCDTYREKVWSEFALVTEETVYGVTIQALLDCCEDLWTVADNVACTRGENTFWLDELPRSKTISVLITINNGTVLTLVSDDDANDVLVDDDSGDELVASVNPGNWTIKEMRLRYREAGPAL